MQVFKCALRILRAYLAFPLIYIVGFSFMSVVIASAAFGTTSTSAFTMGDATFTVIDRDDSALSRSITEFLGEDGTEVVVADDDFAMQDAIAKGLTDYMLIIPKGYGDEFVRAAIDDEKEPKLEAVFSSISIIATFVDQYVNEYVGLVRTLLIADAQRDSSLVDAVKDAKDALSSQSVQSAVSAAVKDALKLAGEHAEVETLEIPQKFGETDILTFYMTWCSFTMFSGIFTCIAVMMSALNGAEVRRRMCASPLTNRSSIMQMALACGVVALAGWAWTFVIGLVFFPGAAAAIGGFGLLLCAIAMLVFAMIPLALGLFLGRLGISLLTCNAIAVLVGQLISFFSGAWISYDLMSEEVRAIAQFLPGYWYANACDIAAEIGSAASSATSSVAAASTGIDMAAFTPYLQDLGVLLLFALVLFSLTFIKRKNA